MRPSTRPLLLPLLAIAAAAPLDDILVSPAAGDDVAGDGTALRPFASLHRAQLAARAALQTAAASGGGGDLTVRIAGGRYELTEPLVFDERDQHAAPSPHRVSWVGPSLDAQTAGEEAARVLCGTVLSGWQHAWGGVYKVRLGRRVWNLAENGRQSNPARHPNTNPGAGMGQLNGSSSTAGFSWNEGALPANISAFGLANTTVLMASGFDYYWTEAWRVGSYNLTARTASFAAATPLFPGDCTVLGNQCSGTVRPGPHFYLQGSVGLIDEPGEFAMDAAGEWLYYWPRSGLPIEDLEIVAPISRRPVQIVGQSHASPVRGLTFRGLEFVASDQDPEGVWYLFNPARCNDTPKRFRNGLIFTENATDIVIEHCKISAAGNAAIWLNLASSHVTIRGNLIEDSAFCGIYAHGFWLGDPESMYKGNKTRAADTYVNHHHVIDSNAIHNVGRLNAGAAGVWLHASGENRVTRNYINRSPRNGVGTFGIHFDQVVQENPNGIFEFKGEDSLTFETQFELAHAKYNEISFNELSNVVRDSCDPGAIESYGIGKGHNVSFNAVHDITQPPVLFHQPFQRVQQIISVLFADAQTHYSEYKGNAVFEVNACGGGAGICSKSWAQNNEGNVFADSSMPHGIDPGDYSGPVGAMTFSHNVFINTTGFCGKGWLPPEAPFPPLPSSPVGVGLVQFSGGYAIGNGDNRAVEHQSPFNDTYRNAVGAGSCYLNASTTCYVGADGVYPNYGCNFFKNCNWPNHRSSYHLSDAQMNTSVVILLDYDLTDQPLDPNVTQVLKLLGREPWQTHSIVTGTDPFDRKHAPWDTDVTDLMATSAEAQKVGHVPLPTDRIGLGSFFDAGFDRRLIGRRNLFREGAPSLGGASPPKIHFEDMDRVRGLTISASLGLVATADFNMGGASTCWAKWKNVVFNIGGNAADNATDSMVAVTVRAQTNAKGGCGVPHPFSPAVAPATVEIQTLRNARHSRFSTLSEQDHMSDIDTDTDSDSGSSSCLAQPILNDSRAGGDYTNHPVVSASNGSHGAALCRASCCADSACAFWGLDVSMPTAGKVMNCGHGQMCCWLKHAAGAGPISKAQPNTSFTGSSGRAPSPPPPPAPTPPTPPPPPPPPFPSPLRLIFSLGAPLPLGGAAATSLGSLELSGGVLVPSGGAESGVFAAAGNGPWCDFEGQIALPPMAMAAAAASGGGGAHDLYVSILSASNHSDQRFALDYFTLRRPD
jgi:hypothetical protein